MKKILAVCFASFVASMALAAGLTLSEARSQISECIKDPAKMKQVVKGLSAADQLTFLAEVNEAISKMPGSNESKAASYLLANRAAVTAAAAGNKTAMIAETFATVPPEVLPVINERFAADLLNIDADPNVKYTNEQFTRIADNIMKKVNERCASAENGAVRSSFAIIMMVNACNNSIPGLAEHLIQSLPESAQNAARTEWIPAAVGQNQTKSYEPILGSADNIGDMVANNVVIRLVGPQLLESMLGDVVEGTPLINNSNRQDILPSGGVREEENQPQPPANPTEEPGLPTEEDYPKEPGGYQDQLLS